MQKVSSVLTDVTQHELNALLTNVGELIPHMSAQECESTISFLIPVLENALKTRDASLVPDHLNGKSGSDLVKAIMERRTKVIPETIQKKKEHIEDKVFEPDQVLPKPQKSSNRSGVKRPREQEKSSPFLDKAFEGDQVLPKPQKSSNSSGVKRAREVISILDDDSDSGEKAWAPYDNEKAPNIKRVFRFGYQHGEPGLFIEAATRFNTQLFYWFANIESLMFIDNLYKRKKKELYNVLLNDISQSVEVTKELRDFLGQTDWGRTMIQSL